MARDEAMRPESKVTDEMRAKMPPKQVEYLASDAFVKSCMKSFDKIDTDKSNALEPRELLPVCAVLVSRIDPSLPPMSEEQCRDVIVTNFDQNLDGKLDRDEWVRVVEYVSACHAIEVRAKTTEKQRVSVLELAREARGE